MRTFSRAVLAALAVLMFTPICVSPSLAADIAAGDVLVADRGNCSGEQTCAPGTGSIRHYSASGVGEVFIGGLSSPWSITTDQLGSIYVSERDVWMVTKFSPFKENLLTIKTGFTPGGVRVGTDGMIYVVDADIDPLVGAKINRYSAAGADLGQFATGLVSVDFMTFDAQGNLYVTGTNSSLVRVVRVFSPMGAGLGDFGPEFFAPAGLAFDSQGNLYVASSTSNDVEKYSTPSGENLGTVALGTPDDSFRGIAFDASGNLYVASSASGNILRFPPAGGQNPWQLGLGRPWDLVVATVTVNPPPVDPAVKTDCKQDGWELFDFRNQGDCTQFVNTGK